jgi:hypothetical protein
MVVAQTRSELRLQLLQVGARDRIQLASVGADLRIGCNFAFS